MEYQRFTFSKNPQKGAHLVYIEDGALLIDPECDWEEIQKFLKINNLTLLYILISKVTFENTYQIAEIKKETRSKFFGFQTDLIKFRNLPRWADERNVCGVKIPHMDGFLKLQGENILGEFLISVVGDENSREYQIGKLRVPAK